MNIHLSHSVAPMSFADGQKAPDSLEKLLFVSKTVLLQAIDLLDNHLDSDDRLTTSSRYLPGSTIGNTCLPPSSEYLSYDMDRKASTACTRPLPALANGRDLAVATHTIL